jgi:hypothetical protein
VSEPEQPPSWQPSYQQAPPGQPYQQAAAAWPPPGQPAPAWPPPGQPYPPPAASWPPPYQAAPPNPYAYPPASRYSYAPPPSHKLRNVLIGSLVVIVVLVAGAVEAAGSKSSTTQGPAASGLPLTHATAAPSAPDGSTAPGSAGGVTAASPLLLATGTSVFADDFTDPNSGWGVGTDDDSTYAYTPAGYSMSSHVPAHFLSYAPYDVPAQQVSLSMTAVEAPGADPGAGFGVTCRRGPDSESQLRYEFVVNNEGRWFVERNEGTLSIAVDPTILNEGSTQLVPGAAALTVSGVCATLANGTTTRLALFLNGVKVVDMLDDTPVDSEGWLGGVLTTNATNDPATAIVSVFSESTLQAPAIPAANT